MAVNSKQTMRGFNVNVMRGLIGLVAGMILLSGAAGVLLRWPVGRLAPSPASDMPMPDIVYLVAGARAQPRRVAALANYARDLAGRTPAGSPLSEVWIGNDFETGPWSASAGRNLTRAEWSLVALREQLDDSIADRYRITIVSGRAWGTDGEMAALAQALAGWSDGGGSPREAIRLALVTCPSHAGRVVDRLRAHAVRPVILTVIAAADPWAEWLPWVSLAEWVKLGRDRAGWSSAPWISRQWYQRQESADDGRRGGWTLAWLLVLLGPVYAWFFYPLLLALAARIKDPPRGEESLASMPTPPDDVDTLILIAAHNESTVIESRLLNLGDQVAPGRRFAVVVGVDGATDATAAAARAGALRLAAKDIPVHIHVDPVRRGKAATLKRLLTRALQDYPHAQWLVFSDANTRFADDALQRLLQPFADQRIGGVCGRLMLTVALPNSAADGGAQQVESLYWQWENRLKAWESRLDSCLGANGAIYAVRKDLFPDQLPDNTIVDDLVIGMRVRAQGFRMVYQPAALAYESLPPTAAEWRRRVRIGAGDFQALGLCRRCLLPRYGWFAWCFLSHKVLRWITPHLIMTAWIIALLGWLRSGLQHPLWPMSAAFVMGAPLIVLVAKTGFRRRGLDYWITMQAALLVGSLQWLRGGLRGDWERTPR